MQATVEQMRERTRREQTIVAEERVFYQILASATHNRALEGISAMLHGFFRQFHQPEYFGEAQWQAVTEHACLIQALRDGNVTDAQTILQGWLHAYNDCITAIETAPSQS